ncbi:Protein C04E6.11, partial [Aphelenchoides avenae]
AGILAPDENELVTPAVVEEVLNRSDWVHAVHTWTKFGETCGCPNGIAVLLRHALQHRKPEDVESVLDTTTVPISPSKKHAFHAAALLSVGDRSKAEEIFTDAADNTASRDYLSAFQVNNTLLEQTDEAVLKRFALDFTRLCLEKTDLRTNVDVQRRWHNEWLALADRHVDGSIATEFYEVFLQHGVKLEADQRNRYLYIQGKQRALKR